MQLAEIISNHKTNTPYVASPFIIAEAGVNHEGSMDLAKRLIEEAKKGGAHAIKFQTYKAETLASKNSPSYWDTSKEATRSQYKLFKKHDKFWKNEFEQLKKHCDEFDIEFLSTPFDVESADFLEDLMPVYKISSSDLSNFPFIEYMCQKEKPILLSTGAAYLWEVMEVVEVIKRYGNPICLMHCILNYPTEDENAYLGFIPTLRQHFPEHIIGYSDHTLPKDMQTLVSATLLGARIIEKHFTHDKSLPGNDHYHAMNWQDLQLFWVKMEQVLTTVGDFDKRVLEVEAISRKNARRSLVAATDIPAETVITKKHLTWKRPAFGISPKHIKDLIGKTTKSAIEKDTILQWNMFE